jgi:deoxyribodipyrimidine photo-lyase
LLHEAPWLRGKADFVLYWMQMYRRAEDNAALAFAIEKANELGLPCLVYEALRPDYPFASDRFHTFVLEGACDTGPSLAARGVRHVFFLPKTRDEARGVLAKLAARAALIVTDDYPSFIIPDQSAALARRVSCPVVAVDDSHAVPLALFPKDEIGARTLRPKMKSVEDAWLVPLEEPVPRAKAPARLDLPFSPLSPLELDRTKVARLVSECAIDHTVPPVAETPGGSVPAEARLEAFLRTKLNTYAEDRNDPSRRGSSGMSPYLHFGMISARRVALRARAAAREGSEGAAAFLEQLLVRRGLAFTFARNNPRHREYAAIPPWAKKTLDEHRKDPRPWIGTLEELTNARTPDALWNAAQTELRQRGVIHGYARMLWGKLPITWMKDPKDAHAVLVHLNDRFALDGRDPDGYASISWCFGIHDRPWPSRPIFGAVRTMTSKSARSKLDFEGYIQTFSARGQMGLGLG